MQEATLAEIGAFCAIVVLPIVAALLVVFIRTQLRILRCPHRPHRRQDRPGVIKSRLIDTGRAKVFWCTDCPWFEVV